jgi:hypothetical protein
MMRHMRGGRAGGTNAIVSGKLDNSLLSEIFLPHFGCKTAAI